MDYNSRLEKLRRVVARRRLDALLVTGEENIHYLSGFTGDTGWALIAERGAFLLTDFRYREQAQEELNSHFGLREVRKGDWPAALARLCAKLRVKRLGFERDHLNFAWYRELKIRLKDVRLRPEYPLVENQRAVKDDGEISLLEQSALLASRVLGGIIRSLRPKASESDIADRIVRTIRRRGGREAFEPIVAAGARSSRPHARASARCLKEGEILLVDMGVKLNRYHSDLTRTFALGSCSARFRSLYRLVLEAQQRAIETIAPGVRAAAVDRVARRVIERGGYGKRFGHALGHGVGLSVHEAPRLGPTSKDVLEEGMVFTVEPGIYIPGWGGIRIEDMVRVTADGCSVLTGAPKDIDSAIIDWKADR